MAARRKAAGGTIPEPPCVRRRFAETRQSRFNIETAWCEAENAQRRSDIGSVLSQGKYIVQLENNPGRDYPETPPHYE